MVKAWRITIRGWVGFEMIWPGETRGQAKASCMEDNPFNTPFTDYRATRAPEFDEQAQETGGKYPWCLGWRDQNEVWGCLKGE
jgi:hypothetical protein